jgi:hypothetical protein
MGTCKQCGAELSGRADQQFCDNNNKCKQRYWRAQQKSDQAQALASELEELRAKVHDQAQTIEEQGQQITLLKRKLDIERFLLEDRNTPYPFLAWLKKQATSPLIEKILAEQYFSPVDKRNYYEYRLRVQLHCSKDEMEEFTELWKLMIL